MNESEYLMANAVGSVTIGLPNFNRLIIDTLIKGINKISWFMEILLIFKAVLAITSFYWIYKLVKNIDFTYRKHTKWVFERYLKNLLITGIIIFVLANVVRWIIF